MSTHADAANVSQLDSRIHTRERSGDGRYSVQITDAHSPAPRELETDIKVHVDAVRVSWSASDQKLEALRKAAEEHIMSNTAFTYARAIKGRRNTRSLRTLQCQRCVEEHEGLLGSRIVIPYSYRQDMLGGIHDGHKGVPKRRERANQCVWWPSMSKEIKETAAKCRHCLEKSPSQKKEPLTPSKLPDYPF